MPLSELARALACDAAVRTEHADVAVSGVCLDSRHACAGDLYLAMQGEHAHGLQYIESALQTGVVAVAIDEHGSTGHADAISLLESANIPVLEIAGLKARAGHIAAYVYREPSKHMQVVAVTGTDGKTSVCRFIAQALQGMGTACGYIGTLGWGLGELNATELTTPDAAMLQLMLASMRKDGAGIVALEASSHGLSEHRLDAIDVNVAVLTNFGRDHLDYHGTLENYRAAKAQLFDWPGITTIVVNGEDSLGAELASSTDNDAVVFYPGNRHAQRAGSQLVIAVADVELDNSGMRFKLIDNGDVFPVSCGLMGRFNIDNLLACHGVLRALGTAANDASMALATISPVPGRMEQFTGSGKATAIVDFAHTPQALEAVLATARQHCKGELWVVFGCGGDRDPGKRAPMGRAAETADRIVVTDDNPRTEESADILEQIVAGMSAPERATVISERALAIEYAVENAQAGDLVVIAGKGHEDYQIVGTVKNSYSDRDTVMRLLQEAS